jgi:hypothetical protein
MLPFNGESFRLVHFRSLTSKVILIDQPSGLVDHPDSEDHDGIVEDVVVCRYACS